MSSAFHKPILLEARDAFVQLATAADVFEQYANPHATRISAIAVEIAVLFHMAKHDRAALQTAALLHDLGESAMERDYIERAGPLTAEERIDLARHPIIGEKEAARAAAGRPVQLLVRWHHEWWNGYGYPDALRREEIPLAARILRVADSYAALTDSRPYRAALTHQEAKREIVSRAGVEFDPAVVQAFLALGPMPELMSYAQSETASLWGQS
jgi:HD-GYP domain-containing protein (c-di-GMP phosphodiesterase class II)